MLNGELSDGLAFITNDSSSPTIHSRNGMTVLFEPTEDDRRPPISSRKKIGLLVCFVSTGFLGSSVAGAITKQVRKAKPREPSEDRSDEDFQCAEELLLISFTRSTNDICFFVFFGGDSSEP